MERLLTSLFLLSFKVLTHVFFILIGRVTRRDVQLDWLWAWVNIIIVCPSALLTIHCFLSLDAFIAGAIASSSIADCVLITPRNIDSLKGLQ